MIKHFISASILTCSSLSFAGGPLVIGGPNGITPLTYQDPNITLDVETGDLGILSNAAANLLVVDAFQLWNQVSTATINLDINPSISTDIDISNYFNYIPADQDDNDLKSNDNINPIIYDSNGEIIDAFLGGVDANGDLPSDYIVGIAASIFTVGSPYFDEGYAVINGRVTSPGNPLTLTDAELKLLIAHEVGHLFGLDHTQVDIDNQEANFSSINYCSDSRGKSAYPLMYPIICRSEDTLHLDDISAISALYPSASTSNSFGILQGRFTDDSGRPVLGANIWAKNTVTGETVSIVSDYLTQRTGFYKMLLPAGSYTLHANSINTEFYAGSGVGPYTYDENDLSFIAPHPISLVTYQGESAGSDEVITITNDQTSVINFATDGKNAVIATESDDGDSIADLFGGTSLMTLLLLFAGLFGSRRLYLARQKANR